MNTSRKVGAAIGVALLVAVTGAATEASDYQVAWLMLAASSAAAAVIGMASWRRGE